MRDAGIVHQGRPLQRHRRGLPQLTGLPVVLEAGSPRSGPLHAVPGEHPPFLVCRQTAGTSRTATSRLHVRAHLPPRPGDRAGAPNLGAQVPVCRVLALSPPPKYKASSHPTRSCAPASGRQSIWSTGLLGTWGLQLSGARPRTGCSLGPRRACARCPGQEAVGASPLWPSDIAPPLVKENSRSGLETFAMKGAWGVWGPPGAGGGSSPRSLVRPWSRVGAAGSCLHFPPADPGKPGEV